MRTPAAPVRLALSLVLTWGLLACYDNVPARAAEPSTTAGPLHDDDRPLAQRILIAESVGDLEQRAQLMAALGEAKSLDALGHSIQGRLRTRDGWKSVEESIAANQQRPAINRYERFRIGQPDSIQGHVQVAQWCRRAGLKAQESAHWQYVLQLDPNHQLARIALGHQLIDGMWVSPEEQAQMDEEVAVLRASLDKYGKNLTKLYAEMMSDREARRQVAVERFFALEDSDAIPAVAAIFSTAPPGQIGHAIRWLSNMREPDATAVLARWSVDHPLEPVRGLCIEGLKQRPRYHYVPQLLERMRTPIVATAIPSFRPDGSLAGVRHVFAREAKDNFEVAIADSVNVRQVNFLHPRDPQRRAGFMNLNDRVEHLQNERAARLANAMIDREVRAAAMREAMQRQWAAAAESLTTEIANERIRIVLSEAAGSDPEATLPELWDWWTDYTERDPDPIKLSAMRYRMNLSRSSVYGAVPPLFNPSCFAAGTTVITARGEKPIESLIVGDQALSKDLETGQLFWDAVVRTTVRPVTPLVTVRTDQEQVTCTGGHQFWVAGKGWTKARDLRDGDVLHGLTRPSVVASVSEAPSQETYNLIIARNRNYFVGESAILSHDFTDPSPTAIRVPGLDYRLVNR